MSDIFHLQNTTYSILMSAVTSSHVSFPPKTAPKSLSCCFFCSILGFDRFTQADELLFSSFKVLTHCLRDKGGLSFGALRKQAGYEKKVASLLSWR